MERSRDLLWGMVALAVAVVVAALIGGAAMLAVKRANDTIAATGSARQRVESDFAVWRCQVQGEGPDRAAAMRQLTDARVQVLGVLQQQGVAAAEVGQTPASVWAVQAPDEFGRGPGRIVGYTGSQTLEVRSADLDRLEALAPELERLLLQGVNLGPMPLEYLFTRLDDVRVALMSDATRDALERARQIAEAAGGSVGPVREARMGVIQVVAPNSTNISDYGTYDTSTRAKDVVAVVKVTFAVD